MSNHRLGFDAFQLETLEPRVLLSAAPVETPSAPSSAPSPFVVSELAGDASDRLDSFGSLAAGIPNLLSEAGPLPSLDELPADSTGPQPAPKTGSETTPSAPDASLGTGVPSEPASESELPSGSPTASDSVEQTDTYPDHASGQPTASDQAIVGSPGTELEFAL